MKIESSQVQMSSESTSYFEMNTTSTVSFKQEIIGFMNVPNNNENIQVNQADFTEQSFNVKYAQSHLQPIEEMTKVILERIFQHLLQGKKEVEFYPKSFNNMSDALPKKELTIEERPTLQFVTKRTFMHEKTIQYEKKDAISFNTTALIKTNDKEINLNIEYSYTKAFFEQHKESLKFEELNFIDPLVIQYDANANAFDSLSENMSFMFDLNSNESLLELPLLKKGNGFLALDKDKNGFIDNGNELFGPRTNNGFEELREYDSDGNNWIDENDPIFNDLLVWSKDDSGDDRLIALGQSGIGALYLTEAKSSFTYNKSVNESMAQLKSSSIFLREDGTAGLLSSLDFIA